MDMCSWRARAALLGVACGLTLELQPAVGQNFSVKDLGRLTNLGQQTTSKPNAINRQGNVAGANIVNGSYRALLYAGSWTNLGTLGGTSSCAAGINEANLVVGYALTANGSDHAFLWRPGGTNGVSTNPQMEDLGTLGGDASEAYAINRSGQVTGFASTSQNDHAFAYDNGVMTDLGMLLGESLPNSYGYAISDLGHIAGTAYNSEYSTAHAFLYDGTRVNDLGTLGGGRTIALGISNGDQVAGYSSTVDGFAHAFRWNDGAMTDLGTLGGNYSYGIGINSSNVVVGGSFVDAANNTYHAFICPGGTLLDLNQQLDATGTGWVLVEARAINDTGQIVGIGTYGGATHAFLLDPLTGAQAPVIQDIKVLGTNAIITFSTVSGRNYSVESCAGLLGETWTQVASGIIGTGGSVISTNPCPPALASVFYRVKLTIP